MSHQWVIKKLINTKTAVRPILFNIGEKRSVISFQLQAK
jgi:hypothetical protein